MNVVETDDVGMLWPKKNGQKKAKVKLKVKDKDTTDHVSMEKLIFIDESVIDPSHQNQPDRQEVRAVTG